VGWGRRRVAAAPACLVCSNDERSPSPRPHAPALSPCFSSLHAPCTHPHRYRCGSGGRRRGWQCRAEYARDAGHGSRHRRWRCGVGGCGRLGGSGVVCVRFLRAGCGALMRCDDAACTPEPVPLPQSPVSSVLEAPPRRRSPALPWPTHPCNPAQTTSVSRTPSTPHFMCTESHSPTSLSETYPHGSPLSSAVSGAPSDGVGSALPWQGISSSQPTSRPSSSSTPSSWSLLSLSSVSSPTARPPPPRSPPPPPHHPPLARPHLLARCCSRSRS
jgi:hypothetical protein